MKLLSKILIIISLMYITTSVKPARYRRYDKDDTFPFEFLLLSRRAEKSEDSKEKKDRDVREEAAKEAAENAEETDANKHLIQYIKHKGNPNVTFPPEGKRNTDRSTMNDRIYVENTGINDFVVFETKSDPFATVVPNAIYYNNEKPCVNWLEDCDAQGIRGRLLYKVRAPYARDYINYDTLGENLHANRFRIP